MGSMIKEIRNYFNLEFFNKKGYYYKLECGSYRYIILLNFYKMMNPE